MPDIRVMTYNVRSCLVYGLKHSPERIAEVIQGFKPDIIALQEVDVGYKFKNGINQAETLAHLLEMKYHFHPSIKLNEEEGYGNAVLSRFPLKLIKAESLPRIETGIRKTILEKLFKAAHEPRGVLWVEADVESKPVQFITTHLGLTQQERWLQVGFLTGDHWLNSCQIRQPVIFCGDFNDTHRSLVYKELVKKFHFKDVQQELKGHKRKPTFFSRWPVRCLDHILFKGPVKVKQCLVPQNKLIAKASDHLPVVADFII